MTPGPTADGALTSKIEAILDAFANGAPRLSPDGKKLLFGSNRGGVDELFVSDATKPSEPAKKVVAGPERATDAQWSRDGNWIVFRRDAGADENYRLYRVKPDRLVVFGGSYGGYLVLMGLTRQPKLWRAGVDFVGIANLPTFLASTDQAIRVAFVDEFGDLDKDKKLLEEFSPMRDVAKITAPLFVYQGANDPRVPRSESDQMVESLEKRGLPVEYMVAADEGHSLDRKPNRIAFLTRVLRFLDARTKTPTKE